MGLFAAATPNWPLGWIVFGLAWSGLANGAFQNNPMMMDNVAPVSGLAGSMAALGRGGDDNRCCLGDKLVVPEYEYAGWSVHS